MLTQGGGTGSREWTVLHVLRGGTKSGRGVRAIKKRERPGGNERTGRISWGEGLGCKVVWRGGQISAGRGKELEVLEAGFEMAWVTQSFRCRRGRASREEDNFIKRGEVV